MTKFTEFFSDDAGVMTINWLAMSSLILVLALLVAYTIFNGGVTPMIATVNPALSGGSNTVFLGEINLE